MNAEIWFFFTPDGQSEITVLNRESAQNLARLMNDNLKHLWMVRKNQSNAVTSVAECAELFSGAESKAPIAMPKKLPRTSGSTENRKFKRFDLRLRVVLISGTRSFRTFSRNISRGGMSFEHVVPKDLLGKECRVIVGSADQKENLEFDARLAGDPQNPRAIEFASGREQFFSKLDDWLKDVKQAA